MAGRYGNDQLNRAMTILSCVLLLLALLIRGRSLSNLLWLFSVAVLVLVYLRMMSRNRYKRIAENNRYLRFTKSAAIPSAARADVRLRYGG